MPPRDEIKVHARELRHVDKRTYPFAYHAEVEVSARIQTTAARPSFIGQGEPQRGQRQATISPCCRAFLGGPALANDSILLLAARHAAAPDEE